MGDGTGKFVSTAISFHIAADIGVGGPTLQSGREKGSKEHALPSRGTVKIFGGEMESSSWVNPRDNSRKENSSDSI